MTRHEHERQCVVGPAGVIRIGETQTPGGRLVGRIERLEPRFTPEPIERFVAGGDREPRRGALRCALEPPLREGGAEGVLHRVLDQLEPARAEQPHQPGADLARLLAEQLLQSWCGFSH